MRWVSLSGDFAFLSFGGTAKGVIAIGGMAHGVIAIGGIVSVGVISIGMNAAGSVAALGMNTAAPISISLINGLGIYTRAGVNGWGAWSHASTNSTGLAGEGGVNTHVSVLPAVLIITIMLVLSSVVRGKRAPRAPDDVLPLRRFVRLQEQFDGPVRARLVAIRENAIDLTDGREQLTLEADGALIAQARAIAERNQTKASPVIVQLARAEEVVSVAKEVGYRERRQETKRFVVRCLDIEPAPEREGWLPKDEAEVQWVIAWSARISVVAAILLLVWWARG